MSETDRVQRWREAKRQQGLKACTVWLTEEEEARLKDLAVTRHCSPSQVVQQALAQFPTGTQPNISDGTDTKLLRKMIRAEIAALQAQNDPITATITDIEQLRVLMQAELAQVPPVTALVTDTVTATLARDLPAMVRTIVEGLALEALGVSVTDTNSYVTDIITPEEIPKAFHATGTAPYRNVTETGMPETPAGPAPAAPLRHRGRKSTLRQPIIDLLSAHPAGLTASQIKVYLHLDRHIGDVLQGMARDHVLEKQGSGAQVRYRAARPSAPPARLPTPAPASRRGAQRQA